MDWKNIKGIGLGIVAFEGTEHLASIITEFRDIVDYVVIGLQRKSYHGDPIEPADLNEIFRLRDEDHLVDYILEVKLDSNRAPREQETDKRNLLIQNIEDNGCSHAIIIDSDEYYTKKSLLRAIQEIDEHDYEITYCQYINYYGDYNHFLVYPFKDGMYVPFISKTKYRHSFECTDFPLPSDPTRRFVRPWEGYDIVMQDGKPMKTKHFTVDYYIFPWETVKMHHLSWLRANMRKKIDNWSSKTCFEHYNDLIDKALDSYEHFDKDSKEQQIASLLFNTPNHEVFVKAFPKQYIHPKYDYMTRLRPAKNEKRIAIMNLSTTNSKIHLYENLEKCGRETWAKDVIDGKYPNIDYWEIIDCKEESHIDEENHTIYIKNDYSKENIMQLLERWLEACELISKTKQYDYVVRTNISTWVNIEFINEMLAYQEDNSKIYTFKFFAAFWSVFNIYCSGAAMIWSIRNINILREIVNNTSRQILDIGYDDVMMSALWRKRLSDIGIVNPDDYFISLEGKYLLNENDNINWNDVDYGIPMYQIKTMTYDENKKSDDDYRMKNDIPKMKKLDEEYRKYRSLMTNEEFSSYVKNYLLTRLNKTVNVIPHSKEEWHIDNEENKFKCAYLEEKPYNEETKVYLLQRAIKCGYKKKEGN